jgi:hypothetical protein
MNPLGGAFGSLLPNGRNPQQMKLKEYLLYGGLGILFLVLIVLYALEFSHFQNAFSIGPMLLVGACAGVVVGAYIAWRLGGTGENATERVQLFVFFIFLGGLFFPLFTSLSNRLLAFGDAEEKAFVFFQEEPFVSSRLGFMEGEEVKPEGYYLYIFYRDELKRIKSPYPLAKGLERGDSIRLAVKSGLWGVDWVVIPSRLE